MTLAVLMPIVASLGGNAGTQALAVAVRALASARAERRQRRAHRRPRDGRWACSTAWRWRPDGRRRPLRLVPATRCCRLAIGLALIINLFVAALAGVLVPLTLDRLGRDPAVSSSVFVTFVTDFVGFLSFLGLAGLILL